MPSLLFIKQIELLFLNNDSFFYNCLVVWYFKDISLIYIEFVSSYILYKLAIFVWSSYKKKNHLLLAKLLSH